MTALDGKEQNGMQERKVRMGIPCFSMVGGIDDGQRVSMWVASPTKVYFQHKCLRWLQLDPSLALLGLDGCRW
jgi:hypothetical protein